MTYAPYYDKNLLYLEITNEILFTLAIYMLPCYTQLMNNEQNYRLGWVMVAIFGIIIAINLLFYLVKLNAWMKSKYGEGFGDKMNKCLRKIGKKFNESIKKVKQACSKRKIKEKTLPKYKYKVDE